MDTEQPVGRVGDNLERTLSGAHNAIDDHNTTDVRSDLSQLVNMAALTSQLAVHCSV